MKKVVSYLAVFILFLAVGCSSKNSINENQNKPMVSPEIDRSFSGVEKHLVMYLDESACNYLNPDTLYILNSMLLKKGCDFVVEFECHSSYTDKEYKDYQEILRRHKEKNEPVDLIFTGYLGADSVEESTYINAVNDNLLLPLDEYLESREGQALKNSFSENEWKMLSVNNSIYGVSNLQNYGYDSPFIVTKTYFEKYGIDLPEVFSWEGILGAISEVMERTDNPNTLLPLYAERTSIAAMYGYYDYGNFWLKKQEDGKIAFVNPYEDPELINTFSLLSEFRKKYGSINNEVLKKALLNRRQCILASFQSVTRDRYNENEIDGIAAKIYEPISQYYSYPDDCAVLGVASWTRYPDEAKKC